MKYLIYKWANKANIKSRQRENILKIEIPGFLREGKQG